MIERGNADMNSDSKKTGKFLGLNFISVGLIFLFLPDFSILDLLPDIIGYILISHGLTRLGDMYEEIADSKKLFMKLIFLGAAKLLGVFIAFGVSDGKDRPTTILMLSFAIAVAEVLLLVPAYIKLFDGLTYIGTREDGVAVFRKPGSKNEKRSYTDSIKRSTISFVIWKNVLSVLPETAALSESSDIVSSSTYSRYEFINYFRFLAIFITLIIGIVWFVKIQKYFSSLKKDEPFIERLKEKYANEILQNETIAIRRRIKNAFFVFTVGAVLTLDVYIDGNAGFNLIPDLVPAACFCIAALILGERRSIYKVMSVVSSAVYGIVSVLSYYFAYSFNQKFHPLDVSRKASALGAWNTLLTVSAAEAVVFIIMLASVSMLLYETVKNHCGYIPIHSSIDPLERSKAIFSRLKKYICIALFFGVCSGAAIFWRVYSFSVDAVSEWSWMIELLVSGIFASVFVLSLLRIKEEVEEKYRFA